VFFRFDAEKKLDLCSEIMVILYVVILAILIEIIISMGASDSKDTSISTLDPALSCYESSNFYVSVCFR